MWYSLNISNNKEGYIRLTTVQYQSDKIDEAIKIYFRLLEPNKTGGYND